jgi:hypothetical protein
MKITVNKQEAERFLSQYFYQKLDEDVEDTILAEEPIREIHTVTYTSEMVQELWTNFVQPTNNNETLWPAKITLIKLFRGLHLKLTGMQCSLVQAKNFIESHKAF